MGHKSPLWCFQNRPFSTKHQKHCRPRPMLCKVHALNISNGDRCAERCSLCSSGGGVWVKALKLGIGWVGHHHQSPCIPWLSRQTTLQLTIVKDITLSTGPRCCIVCPPTTILKETNADGKLSLPPPYKGEPSLQYLQSTPTLIPVNVVNTALKSFHVTRFPWCSHTRTLITTENPFLHWCVDQTKLMFEDEEHQTFAVKFCSHSTRKWKFGALSQVELCLRLMGCNLIFQHDY